MYMQVSKIRAHKRPSVRKIAVYLNDNEQTFQIQEASGVNPGPFSIIVYIAGEWKGSGTKITQKQSGQMFGMFAFLPAMGGATRTMLFQALDLMVQYHRDRQD